MYSGEPVSLEQLLNSREQRGIRQREWLNKHSLPLISFTINMVGEVKVNTLSTVAFEQGIEAIVECCQRSSVFLTEPQRFEANTGLEFIAAASNITALELKAQMVDIEDSHPLGRLFDIDIIDRNGVAVSRDSMSLPRRRCMVCNDDAKICARSRRHEKSVIIEKMSQLVSSTLQ
ncbi:citrate lyase holo-[acyl-carrier protein] synthase [Vibrio sp. F74]|uniref:citrate lyase holo-[acyl-carrier protein] synthase n=1 Tax=Vibrio sp. F74 TaxID=700020 RepID=UPI0035F55C5C